MHENQNEETATAAGSDNEAYLNPYQKWQKRNADVLIDGTTSQQSYVRIATDGKSDIGIKPQLHVCDKHIHLGFRLRCAPSPQPVQSADEPVNGLSSEAAPEGIDALFAFSQSGYDSWSKASSERLSRAFSLVIPFNVKAADAVEQWQGLWDNGLYDLILKHADVVPAGGFLRADLTAGRRALMDFLRTQMNAMGVFNEVIVTDRQWTEETVGGELSLELVSFLQQDPSKASKLSQEGDSDADADSEDDSDDEDDNEQ